MFPGEIREIADGALLALAIRTADVRRLDERFSVRKMAEGANCFVTLRSTKLEMRQNYRDPRIWAAFIVEGDPTNDWKSSGLKSVTV
jgi:hypothetical protein